MELFVAIGNFRANPTHFAAAARSRCGTFRGAFLAGNSTVKRQRTVAVLAVILAGLGGAPGSANTHRGLPLRDPWTVSNPDAQRFALLAGSLRFKLGRIMTPETRRTLAVADAAGIATWRTLVAETVMLARRLGAPDHYIVTASRTDSAFMVVIQGEGYVAGPDADRVLGRLLHVLTAGGEALPVADQSLSATLSRISP